MPNMIATRILEPSNLERELNVECSNRLYFSYSYK